MQREYRYTVLKNTDISSYLTVEEQEQLYGICLKIEHSRLHAGKEKLQCVVVESDWPEYEPTWQAISDRVDLENIC